MQLVPSIKHTKENSLGEFIAGDHVFIGIKEFDNDSKFKYGLANCLWAFSSKLDPDEAVYVQVMFAIENEAEKELIDKNPLNIKNLPEEDIEQNLKPVLSKMKIGENAFNSNLRFTIAENPKYYKFEGRAHDKDTKTDIIRSIQVPEYMYLHITKITYWMMLHPELSWSIIAPPCLKEYPVITRKIIGVTADDSTNQNDMVVTHLTLYYTEDISTGHIGVNVYMANDKNRLLKHFITNEEFNKLYGFNEPIVFPENVFSAFTPEKMHYLTLPLTPFEQFVPNIIYSIDDMTAKRVHWLDWGYYVYLNYEEDNKK